MPIAPQTRFCNTVTFRSSVPAVQVRSLCGAKSAMQREATCSDMRPSGSARQHGEWYTETAEQNCVAPADPADKPPMLHRCRHRAAEVSASAARSPARSPLLLKTEHARGEPASGRSTHRSTPRATRPAQCARARRVRSARARSAAAAPASPARPRRCSPAAARRAAGASS